MADSSFQPPKFLSALVKNQTVILANNIVKLPPIQTGSVSLDFALGGGIPQDHLTVLWGKAGSGKSWLAMKLMAEQLNKNKNGYAIYVDTENSVDVERMEKCGVDTERVFFIQGNTPEDILGPLGKMESEVIEDKRLVFFCVDSIKGLTTVNEFSQMSSGNFESAVNAYGGIAKCINPLLRMLVRWSLKVQFPTILTNHVSMSMDLLSAKYDPYKMGGGKTLEHLMAACVYMEKVSKKDAKITTGDEGMKNIDGTDLVIGNTVRCKVNKSRRTVEGKRALFDVNFETGLIVNKEAEVFALAENLGLISKEGITYRYKDYTGKHKSGFVETLKREKRAYAELVHEVLSMSANSSILGGEEVDIFAQAKEDMGL